MGKSSNPIIGYSYGLGVHMGLCVGPVDQLTQIVCGGKVAWTGSVTASGPISINQPNLFGGEHKEGGIVGTAQVLMGEQTQTPNAYLETELGTPMTAFRGLLTILYRGLVSAMSPYLKAWSFQVSKWTVGWRTPVWQPSLAKINEGMNAAHIIYRAVTDPVTGLGRDPSTLDLDRMLTAAQTLYNESMGLNFKWSRSDVLANFVAMVCTHVGGDFVDDPTTGLEYLKLYRADYDIATVPLIDESNIIDLQSFEVPALDGSVNEVTVTYHDYTTNKDATVTVQNLANVQAQGRVVNQSNQYPGIGVAALATRVAMRDLRAQSALPVRIKAKVQGTVAVRKGDVLAFSWARLNVSRMAVRVLEIDRGTPTASAMVLTLAQDVYDVPSNAYIVVQPPRWTPPNTVPAPVPDQVLVEASYRDLAANLRPADLAQVSATAGYIGALGDLPPCVATGYQLQTSVDSGVTWQLRTTGPFAPSALLEADMPQEAGPTVATLISGSNLDLMKVPCEVLIDNETMRCDSIDSTTGLVTLARGCVDTVPAAHTAGAQVWFTDGWTAADPTEYITSETVQAKLLTQTGSGTLDPSDAPTASVTLNSRQVRPYAPGGLLIGAVAYPTSVIEPMPAITWAHRDRLNQADQLIDTTQANIGPETDVTYTMRSYFGGTLYDTQSGITGTTATPATPSGYGSVRVEVESDRGAYASWQSLTATFDYRSALAITTTSVRRQIGVAGSYQMQATGGQLPLTWSIDPSTPLPAGMSMDATGNISDAGTAVAADTPVTFIVTDSVGTQVSKSITVSVADFSTRWWRVLITDHNGGTYCQICEMEFRAAPGGANLAAGGTAFASGSANAQNLPSFAFNGDPSDKWTARSGYAVPSAPESLGYELPAAAWLREITVDPLGTTSVSATYAPKDFTVQSSVDSTNGNDGTWSDEWIVAGQTGWAAGEVRTFTRP